MDFCNYTLTEREREREREREIADISFTKAQTNTTEQMEPRLGIDFCYLSNVMASTSTTLNILSAFARYECFVNICRVHCTKRFKTLLASQRDSSYRKYILVKRETYRKICLSIRRVFVSEKSNVTPTIVTGNDIPYKNRVSDLR